jgi:hypothetical protein
MPLGWHRARQPEHEPSHSRVLPARHPGLAHSRRRAPQTFQSEPPPGGRATNAASSAANVGLRRAAGRPSDKYGVQRRKRWVPPCPDAAREAPPASERPATTPARAHPPVPWRAPVCSACGERQRRKRPGPPRTTIQTLPTRDASLLAGAPADLAPTTRERSKSRATSSGAATFTAIIAANRPRTARRAAICYVFGGAPAPRAAPAPDGAPDAAAAPAPAPAPAPAGAPGAPDAAFHRGGCIPCSVRTKKSYCARCT